MSWRSATTLFGRVHQRPLTHALMLAVAAGVVLASTFSTPLPVDGDAVASDGSAHSLRPHAIVPGVMPQTTNGIIERERQAEMQLAQAQASTVAPARPAPQLKTYVVEEGDNPFDLANAFGISDETLLAANGLDADGATVLQIGQRLLIPPVSGVVVSTQGGETARSIADQWKIDLAKLLSVNRLSSPTAEFMPGEPLMIPDALPPVSIYPTLSDEDTTDPKAIVKADAPAPARPASSPQARRPVQDAAAALTRPAVRRSSSNNFPFGQCTYWAAQSRPDIGSAVVGNAASWLYSARAAGLATGYTPRVGAVVVYQPGAQGAAWTGHVAVVTSVSGNNFTISEMNFPYWGRVTSRSSWTSPGVAFIY